MKIFEVDARVHPKSGDEIYNFLTLFAKDEDHLKARMKEWMKRENSTILDDWKVNRELFERG